MMKAAYSPSLPPSLPLSLSLSPSPSHPYLTFECRIDLCLLELIRVLDEGGFVDSCFFQEVSTGL